jgi:Kef-type K+ transport system membrane component KefB/mannitol/fructose-specific phosphotransferase system IIA component (Ntr-type)
MNPEEMVHLLIAIGLLLAFSRLLGETARRFDMPSVLGEIVAGILLGPTILGSLLPGLEGFLFPKDGNVMVVINSLADLAVVLFLFVAGMEVDLSTMFNRGRTTLTVSLFSLLPPFMCGFALAWWLPEYLGREPTASVPLFALFLATCLAISALPVIARTLMDLNLYHSDFGMVIIAAAVFNDLCGWLIFAFILAMIGAGHGYPISVTLLATMVYSVVMLTVGRWAVHRSLPWLQAHTTWPGGILAIGVSLALINGAFTEFLGVHAIFGAFLFGVALGDSQHMRQQTRNIIQEFISSIFAPLFFATIGLKVNFITHFDFGLVAILFPVACIGKILGCYAGARLCRMTSRESWGLGFGLNSRGAMEIVLGLMGLYYGIINERLFVALVVVALGTSIISGPMMQWILQLEKPKRIGRFLHASTFLGPLPATNPREAIRQLSAAAATAAGLGVEEIDRAVWAREKAMHTGIGNGVAIPHARLGGITTPVVAVGISLDGIDFDAPDGEAAHLIFLILTPAQDAGVQLEILADIAKTFQHRDLREQALQTRSYVEFLALMNVGEAG